MRRERLRRALERLDGREVIALPLIERHAARLEQVSAAQWTTQAQVQMQMHRCAQRLYDLDAVTIGGSTALLAAACWSASGREAPEAWQRAGSAERIEDLPDSGVIATSAVIECARDATRRLRAVLLASAGIVAVLPTARRLVEQVGRPDALDWAEEALAATTRALGPDEFDAIAFVGEDEELDPSLVGQLEFFGTPALLIGSGAAGWTRVAALPDWAPKDGAWLFATPAEVAEGTAPAEVRKAIDRVRLS